MGLGCRLRPRFGPGQTCRGAARAREVRAGCPRKAGRSGARSAGTRDEAVKMGIRINGLPILAVEPDLDVYFRESVIGGPGAFIIPVKSYDAFAEAILRKLVAEISQDNAPRPKFALQ